MKVVVTYLIRQPKDYVGKFKYVLYDDVPDESDMNQMEIDTKEKAPEGYSFLRIQKMPNSYNPIHTEKDDKSRS